MAEFVVIERASDGAQLAVRPSDFEKGVDGDYKGFKILHWEGGEKYDGPKTSAAITKAQDAPSKAEKGSE